MLIVASAVGAGVMGDSMLYAVLPSNVESFGLQVGFVGLVLSVNRFTRLVTNDLAGRAYQRLGLFYPFVGALALSAVVTAGYALVSGLWPLLALRVVWGVCFSFLRLGGYLTAVAEPSEVRGRLMGLYGTGFRGGQMAGALLGAVIADAFGNDRGFYLLAVLTGLFLFSTVLGWGGRGEPQVALSANAGGARLWPRGYPLFKRVAWILLISAPEGLTRPLRYRLLAVNAMRFSVGFALEGLLVASMGLLLRRRLGDVVSLGVIQAIVQCEFLC